MPEKLKTIVFQIPADFRIYPNCVAAETDLKDENLGFAAEVWNGGGVSELHDEPLPIHRDTVASVHLIKQLIYRPTKQTINQ